MQKGEFICSVLVVGEEFLTQQPHLSKALEVRTSWTYRFLQAREGLGQPLEEG